MRRSSPLKRKTELARTALARRDTPTRTRPLRRSDGISPASRAQREAIQGVPCIVCHHPPPCHPAHIIDRSLLSDRQDDFLAVVSLCGGCHRRYDEGGLSILSSLEPHYRQELAFAVERFGLVATYRRVTNDREAA